MLSNSSWGKNFFRNDSPSLSMNSRAGLFNPSVETFSNHIMVLFALWLIILFSCDIIYTVWFHASGF